MDKRGKHRIIFAVPALLAFLGAAWVLGNLLASGIPSRSPWTLLRIAKKLPGTSRLLWK